MQDEGFRQALERAREELDRAAEAEDRAREAYLRAQTMHKRALGFYDGLFAHEIAMSHDEAGTLAELSGDAAIDERYAVPRTGHA